MWRGSRGLVHGGSRLDGLSLLNQPNDLLGLGEDCSPTEAVCTREFLRRAQRKEAGSQLGLRPRLGISSMFGRPQANPNPNSFSKR